MSVKWLVVLFSLLVILGACAAWANSHGTEYEYFTKEYWYDNKTVTTTYYLDGEVIENQTYTDSPYWLDDGQTVNHSDYQSWYYGTYVKYFETTRDGNIVYSNYTLWPGYHPKIATFCTLSAIVLTIFLATHRVIEKFISQYDKNFKILSIKYIQKSVKVARTGRPFRNAWIISLLLVPASFITMVTLRPDGAMQFLFLLILSLSYFIWFTIKIIRVPDDHLEGFYHER